MVEVFKTNVWDDTQATELTTILLSHFPLYRIDFDLEDCDKILRVEGEHVAHKRIIDLASLNGYECLVLE